MSSLLDILQPTPRLLSLVRGVTAAHIGAPALILAVMSTLNCFHTALLICRCCTSLKTSVSPLTTWLSTMNCLQPLQMTSPLFYHQRALLWRVWLIDGKKRGDVICKGWKQFMVDNHVVRGDTLVLTLVQHRQTRSALEKQLRVDITASMSARAPICAAMTPLTNESRRGAGCNITITYLSAKREPKPLEEPFCEKPAENCTNMLTTIPKGAPMPQRGSPMLHHDPLNGLSFGQSHRT